jgi:KGK domain
MSDSPIYLTSTSDQNTVVQIGSGLFKVEQLDTQLRAYLSANHCEGLNDFLAKQRLPPILDERIFSYPVVCQVLRPDGAGWQEGQIAIKISLEFKPSIKPQPEVDPVINSNVTETSALEAFRQAEATENQV